MCQSNKSDNESCSNFSPVKSSVVYVAFILLNQDNTSFMSAEDLMSIGI